MKSEGIGHAPESPSVFFADREDFGRSSGYGLREYRVGVGHGQDHSDRIAT